MRLSTDKTWHARPEKCVVAVRLLFDATAIQALALCMDCWPAVGVMSQVAIQGLFATACRQFSDSNIML